jgi:cell wall integrity and stress response component
MSWLSYRFGEFPSKITDNADNCGNSTGGYFTYLQIGQSSGTLSSNQNPTSAKSVSTAHSSAKPTTRTVTINLGTTVIVTSFLVTDSGYPLSSGAQTLNGANASSITEEPSQSSEGSDPTPAGINEPTSSFWNSTGKVIAVFVVVGAILVTIFVTGIVICTRRRARPKPEQSQGKQHTGDAARSSSDPSLGRSASFLQILGRKQAGLTWSTPEPQEPQMTMKSSILTVPMVDQRLDPHSMMARFEDNNSHTSFRDDEDYSRRIWRVTNASESDSLHSVERYTTA